MGSKTPYKKTPQWQTPLGNYSLKMSENFVNDLMSIYYPRYSIQYEKYTCHHPWNNSKLHTEFGEGTSTDSKSVILSL